MAGVSEVISMALELKDRMTGALGRATDALKKAGRVGAQTESAFDKFGAKAGEKFGTMPAAGSKAAGLFRMAVDSVGGRIKALSGLSDQTASSFASLGIRGAVGFAALGAAAYKAIDAVGELAKEGIDLNRQFENTSIRIAGTLKAFDVAPTFAKAQAQAASVMGTVADLAAKLPGETEDYVSVFATALPKALAAGMSDMEEVAKFTSYWTAVATSNMVDANQAGMDLFRMLSGQAGADVRMFTVLAEKIGLTAETFNKLSAPERLAAIQQALGAFDAQLEAAGGTYEAKLGEYESRIKEIKRLGTEVSFERAKSSLDDMNKTLEKNKGEYKAAIETLTSSFAFFKDGTQSLLLDIGAIAAKLFNTITLANTEIASIRQQEAAAPKKAGVSEAELAERARRARMQEYETSGYAKIEALLPEKMQRGLGPMGLATPKVFEELIKIGKRAYKTDPVLTGQIADYIEFMKYAGDPELAYFKMAGVRLDGKKKHERRETAKAPNFDFRNSRFDIKQNFAEGFDPDRIAVAFASDLGRLGEMKTQSGYVHTATMR